MMRVALAVLAFPAYGQIEDQFRTNVLDAFNSQAEGVVKEVEDSSTALDVQMSAMRGEWTSLWNKLEATHADSGQEKETVDERQGQINGMVTSVDAAMNELRNGYTSTVSDVTAADASSRNKLALMKQTIAQGSMDAKDDVQHGISLLKQDMNASKYAMRDMTRFEYNEYRNITRDAERNLFDLISEFYLDSKNLADEQKWKAKEASVRANALVRFANSVDRETRKSMSLAQKQVQKNVANTFKKAAVRLEKSIEKEEVRQDKTNERAASRMKKGVVDEYDDVSKMVGRNFTNFKREVTKSENDIKRAMEAFFRNPEMRANMLSHLLEDAKFSIAGIEKMTQEVRTQNGVVQRRVADSTRAKAQAFQKKVNSETAFIQSDAADMATQLSMALEGMVAALKDQIVQKFETVRGDRQRELGKARDSEREAETEMRDEVGQTAEELRVLQGAGATGGGGVVKASEEAIGKLEAGSTEAQNKYNRIVKLLRDAMAKAVGVATEGGSDLENWASSEVATFMAQQSEAIGRNGGPNSLLGAVNKEGSHYSTVIRDLLASALSDGDRAAKKVSANATKVFGKLSKRENALLQALGFGLDSGDSVLYHVMASQPAELSKLKEQNEGNWAALENLLGVLSHDIGNLNGTLSEKRQAVHDAIMTELRKGKDDSLQKFLDGVNGDDSKFHSDFTLLADAVRAEQSRGEGDIEGAESGAKLSKENLGSMMALLLGLEQFAGGAADGENSALEGLSQATSAEATAASDALTTAAAKAAAAEAARVQGIMSVFAQQAGNGQEDAAGLLAVMRAAIAQEFEDSAGKVGAGVSEVRDDMTALEKLQALIGVAVGKTERDGRAVSAQLGRDAGTTSADADALAALMGKGSSELYNEMADGASKASGLAASGADDSEKTARDEYAKWYTKMMAEMAEMLGKAKQAAADGKASVEAGATEAAYAAQQAQQGFATMDANANSAMTGFKQYLLEANDAVRNARAAAGNNNVAVNSQMHQMQLSAYQQDALFDDAGKTIDSSTQDVVKDSENKIAVDEAKLKQRVKMASTRTHAHLDGIAASLRNLKSREDMGMDDIRMEMAKVLGHLSMVQRGAEADAQRSLGALLADRDQIREAQADWPDLKERLEATAKKEGQRVLSFALMASRASERTADTNMNMLNALEKKAIQNLERNEELLSTGPVAKLRKLLNADRAAMHAVQLAEDESQWLQTFQDDHNNYSSLVDQDMLALKDLEMKNLKSAEDSEEDAKAREAALLGNADSRMNGSVDELQANNDTGQFLDTVDETVDTIVEQEQKERSAFNASIGAAVSSLENGDAENQKNVQSELEQIFQWQRQIQGARGKVDSLGGMIDKVIRAQEDLIRQRKDQTATQIKGVFDSLLGVPAGNHTPTSLLQILGLANQTRSLEANRKALLQRKLRAESEMAELLAGSSAEA